MAVWKQTPAAAAVLLPLLLIAVSCRAADLFDIIEWSISDKNAEVRAEGDEGASKPTNCLCDGYSCICCIDFNVTFVDLGGPGCVRMKYLSQEEGFAVNVSYGKVLLRSKVVKGPDPEPVCINILSRVAQLCARLTDLAPTSDGLRGCLQLEPTLLGDPQLDFPLGCFRSGPEGMTMEAFHSNSTAVEEEEEEEEETDASNNGTAGINTAQIIQVVNQSAEEGIAFISNLLGLTFGGGNKTSPAGDAAPKPEVKPELQQQQPETHSSARNSKAINPRSRPNMI